MSLWHRDPPGSDPVSEHPGDAPAQTSDEADIQIVTGAGHDLADDAGMDASDQATDDPEAAVLDEIADVHADLVERFDYLLGEVGKLGREQFRATTLLEGHDTILEELAESSREERERRAAGPTPERLARAEIEAQARLVVAKELLTVADALDASIRTAHELLTSWRAAPSRPVPPARPWWRAWLPGSSPSPGPAPEATGRADSLEAWLRGLRLTEERLRALLDRQGVRPMHTSGERFDPHRHLAVAVSEAGDAADGTIVAEDLRGYMAGERVLRHAEVVVARSAGEPGRSGPGDS